MGLNGIRQDLLADSGVTGIFERHRTDVTVELALKLTKAEGIVVINDTSETGRANEATLVQVMKTYPEVQWVVERDISVDDIERLRQYPADWPVVPMLPLRERGPNGPMLSQARSVELLRTALPHPLFYDTVWLMGKGMVGGFLMLDEGHARQAGELATAVLKGARPEDLPVRFDNPHAWIFDDRELKRFGWSRADLPAGSEVRFESLSYLERHRELIVPAAVLLIVAALVIVTLAETVRRQRRAERALRAQEHRLSTALAASDAGVFEIQGPTGHASSRWLELIGIPVEDANQPDTWMKHAAPRVSKRGNPRSISCPNRGAANDSSSKSSLSDGCSTCSLRPDGVSTTSWASLRK